MLCAFRHAEEAAKNFISQLEAIIKTVEEVRDTPEDLEGLILSIPDVQQQQQQQHQQQGFAAAAPMALPGHDASGHALSNCGSNGLSAPTAKLSESSNKGDHSSGSVPVPISVSAALLRGSATHRFIRSASGLFLTPSTPSSSSTSAPLPSPHSTSCSLSDDELMHLRRVESIRFEELLEWFLAETENNLSDARLLVSRLDGEMKHITLALASKRNKWVKAAP